MTSPAAVAGGRATVRAPDDRPPAREVSDVSRLAGVWFASEPGATDVAVDEPADMIAAAAATAAIRFTETPPLVLPTIGSATFRGGFDGCS
jgi:hypothetical protein